MMSVRPSPLKSANRTPRSTPWVVVEPAKSIPGKRHDVEVEGEFGRLLVHVENVPSENPRTGRLTALSIIRSVQDTADSVRIGT